MQVAPESARAWVSTGVRGQVQVGEERVARAQPRDLVGLGLLDLDDQLGLAEGGLGVGHDGCALGEVLGVGDARALAGAGLHEDAVAALDELACAGGCQRDPVLIRLRLSRDTDLHRRYK